MVVDWKPGILSLPGHNKWINATLFSSQFPLSGGQISRARSAAGDSPAVSLRSGGVGLKPQRPGTSLSLPRRRKEARTWK